MIGALIKRDLRRGLTGSAWLPLAFFLIVASLVPFAIGPDAQLLGASRPGRAVDRRVDRRADADRAAGRARPRRWRARPARAPRRGGELTVLAKIVAHWLSFGPLLIAAAFPAAMLLGLDPDSFRRVLISAVGTPGIAALAVMIAAVTAGLPRGGSLAGLLLFPLAVPLLIFASAFAGDGGQGALLLEAAVSLGLVALCAVRRCCGDQGV